MKKKTVRALLLLFTLTFTVASFSMTAWAESGSGNITPTPATSETSKPVSSGEPASQKTSQPEESAQSEAPVPSKKTSTESEKSTQSEAKEPVSQEPAGNDNTPSSRISSKKEYVDPDNVISGNATSVADRPNTHESHINQNAPAIASTSPKANSENWNNLLSGTSSAASVVSSTTVSVAAGGAGTITTGKKGGTSSLFLLGVALIIGAVCGIGIFIYLQFFSHKHRGSVGNNDDNYAEDGDGFEYATSELERITGNGPAARATATVVPHHVPETMDDFTDINSSSDGIQHREEYEEFVERTKPPIVPKPATRAPSPAYTPAKKDEETLVLPTLSGKEAAQRAQQSQTARAQSYHRQPPLTSNAVPRNMRGRPSTVQAAGNIPISRPRVQQNPTVQRTPQPQPVAPVKRPTPPTVQKAAVSAPRPVVQRKNNSTDFDWDKFLNDNRRS